MTYEITSVMSAGQVDRLCEVFRKRLLGQPLQDPAAAQRIVESETVLSKKIDEALKELAKPYFFVDTNVQSIFRVTTSYEQTHFTFSFLAKNWRTKSVGLKPPLEGSVERELRLAYVDEVRLQSFAKLARLLRSQGYEFADLWDLLAVGANFSFRPIQAPGVRVPNPFRNDRLEAPTLFHYGNCSGMSVMGRMVEAILIRPTG